MTQADRISLAKRYNELLSQGLNRKQISREVDFAYSTVVTHLKALANGTFVENSPRVTIALSAPPVAQWCRENMHLAKQALEIAYRIRGRLSNTTTDPLLKKYSPKGKR